MSIFVELATGVIAATAEQMRHLASRIAAELPADRTLALSGDLGTGKTTFVQGLASAWGVREAVTSPSYTVCNLHRGTRLLVHVDAYRLPDANAWDGLMIEEFLESPWCLVVEWADRVRDRLPPEALWLRFTMNADQSRIVQRMPDRPLA